VDVDLWRAAGPLIARDPLAGKEAMARTPTIPLPAEITNRSKTGFTTPVQGWVAADGPAYRNRGLRGWAQRVYAEHHNHS
jgi:hypothetical protein